MPFFLVAPKTVSGFVLLGFNFSMDHKKLTFIIFLLKFLPSSVCCCCCFWRRTLFSFYFSLLCPLFLYFLIIHNRLLPFFFLLNYFSTSFANPVKKSDASDNAMNYFLFFYLFFHFFCFFFFFSPHLIRGFSVVVAHKFSTWEHINFILF